LDKGSGKVIQDYRSADLYRIADPDPNKILQIHNTKFNIVTEKCAENARERMHRQRMYIVQAMPPWCREHKGQEYLFRGTNMKGAFWE
jgi:hypothetical protein